MIVLSIVMENKLMAVGVCDEFGGYEDWGDGDFILRF